MVALPVRVRPFREADLPYVMSTWLNHFASSSSWAKHIPRSTFFDSHRPLVESLLRRQGVSVSVAVDPEDADTIYGWLAHEQSSSGPVLHFAYVKNSFRRTGVLNTLLEAIGTDLSSVTVTHWTDSCSEMNRSHTLSYNPYLIWT